MGVLVWFLAKHGEPWILSERNIVIRVALLGALVVFGVIFYLFAVIATRVYSVAELKNRLTKRSRL
jgi:hypothetical protein